MLSEGKPLDRIALAFDVSRNAIAQVINGVTWKHVPRPAINRPANARDRWGRLIRYKIKHVPATP
jgi:hypothetical protein